MRRSWLIALAIRAAALLALSRTPIRVVTPPSAAIEELTIEMLPEPAGPLAAPEPRRRVVHSHLSQVL